MELVVIVLLAALVALGLWVRNLRAQNIILQQELSAALADAERHFNAAKRFRVDAKKAAAKLAAVVQDFQRFIETLESYQ